ncbi:hypothetical protein BZG36_03868 [Bifiguratus adelaidae]|uniref:UDENN domain-containing protein n=1 Tax=Bifiguratus adelaidae TaxID=1938954 RepID=A0A261XXS0_9FUNG|nr:hypothetical protein BZG36_03868 [Bifiguratus adelaidae]
MSTSTDKLVLAETGAAGSAEQEAFAEPSSGEVQGPAMALPLTTGNVVAVFVARFDTTKGNIIAWQFPADIALEGVEFKAICSGLHNVNSDMIYFNHDAYYGVAAYLNTPTRSSESRGSHMLSCGILVKPTEESGRCGAIWRHTNFLATVVREIEMHGEEAYDQLEQYYENNKRRDATEVDQEEGEDDVEEVPEPDGTEEHETGQGGYFAIQSPQHTSSLPLPPHITTNVQIEEPTDAELLTSPLNRNRPSHPAVSKPALSRLITISASLFSPPAPISPRTLRNFRPKSFELADQDNTTGERQPQRSMSTFSFSALMPPTPTLGTMSYAYPPVSMSSSLYDPRDHPPLDIHHPAHFFPDFVRLFGASIFHLWRAVMCKQRILFMVDAPVEIGCKIVYCTCLLGTLPTRIAEACSEQGRQRVKPLFSVGVNDLDKMETITGGYVACTTDTVFELKKHVYDLLVRIPGDLLTHLRLELPPQPSQPHLTSRRPTKSPSSILLSNWKRTHPEFRPSSPDASHALPLRFSPTDLRRYRLLRRILLDYTISDARSESIREYGMSDRGDTVWDTCYKVLIDGWFWWYGRERVAEKEQTRLLDSDDEDDDEGRRPKPLLRTSSTMDPDELVISEGEEDARELGSGSGVMLGMAGYTSEPESMERGSSSHTSKEDTKRIKDMKRTELEVELIRFFHLLSTHLISNLSIFLSKPSHYIDDPAEEYHRLPSHIISTLLGLDPHADATFVIQLARIYANKDIELAHRSCMGDCDTLWDSCPLWKVDAVALNDMSLVTEFPNLDTPTTGEPS